MAMTAQENLGECKKAIGDNRQRYSMTLIIGRSNIVYLYIHVDTGDFYVILMVKCNSSFPIPSAECIPITTFSN
jgi:hypothetical protein